MLPRASPDRSGSPCWAIFATACFRRNSRHCIPDFPSGKHRHADRRRRQSALVSDRFHQPGQRDQSGGLCRRWSWSRGRWTWANWSAIRWDTCGGASLLRNLADRVAPERLPPLQLTSAPVDADLKSGSMQLARWSSLITLPKVPLAERKYFTATPARPSSSRIGTSMAPFAGFAGMSRPWRDAPAHAHPGKLQTALSRSKLREALLISLAVLEAVYLLGSRFRACLISVVSRRSSAVRKTHTTLEPGCLLLTTED